MSIESGYYKIVYEGKIEIGYYHQYTNVFHFRDLEEAFTERILVLSPIDPALVINNDPEEEIRFMWKINSKTFLIQAIIIDVIVTSILCILLYNTTL